MSDGGGVIVGLYLLEVEVVGWVERVPVTQLHEDGVEQISVSCPVRCRLDTLDPEFVDAIFYKLRVRHAVDLGDRTACAEADEQG